MHKISTHVESVHRVVAMLVAMAVLAWSVGMFERAQAANLTQISNTLTSSEPSTLSGHDIRFTVPTGSSVAPADDITITFPAGFTGVSTIVSGDLTVTANAAPQTIGGFTAVGQVVTFNGVTASSGQEVRIIIADTRVTNPAGTDSYEFVVTAGADDEGRMRVAILPTVEVTAIVETTFEFIVTGLNAGETVNGTTTTGTSSSTTIPFGVLEHDTIYNIGQELTVSTNARNGFVVTVEKDSPFQSSTGAIIDSFTDGTFVNTPTAWVAPGRDILDELTWGHWGLTSDDATLNAGEFTSGGGDRWIAASTTPRAVFTHDGPSDGTTQNIGLARVSYAVEITPFQEAGFDYSTTLMYIATPTF